jgi:hypothetical protein
MMAVAVEAWTIKRPAEESLADENALDVELNLAGAVRSLDLKLQRTRVERGL